MSEVKSLKGNSSAPHHHSRPCAKTPQARNKPTFFSSAQICYHLNERLLHFKDTKTLSLRVRVHQNDFLTNGQNSIPTHTKIILFGSMKEPKRGPGG